MIFYHDLQEEWGINQFGISLWNDTVISIAIPTHLELWTNETVGGRSRTCLFGLDIVEIDFTRSIEFTVLFVLFSIEWEKP